MVRAQALVIVNCGVSTSCDVASLSTPSTASQNSSGRHRSTPVLVPGSESDNTRYQVVSCFMIGQDLALGQTIYM